MCEMSATSSFHHTSMCFYYICLSCIVFNVKLHAMSLSAYDTITCYNRYGYVVRHRITTENIGVSF
jgi:hypothetical protein